MTTSRLRAPLLTLALLLAGSPLAAMAVDGGPAEGQEASSAQGAAESQDPASRKVAFEPLFKARAKLKVGKTAKLRFRVRDLGSGKPVAREDILVSLRHPGGPEAQLPVRRIKEGVYEVSFRPRAPGEHALVVLVRGAAVGAIEPLRLGVVGAAAGLEKVDDPALEAELQARMKQKGRTR